MTNKTRKNSQCKDNNTSEHFQYYKISPGELLSGPGDNPHVIITCNREKRYVNTNITIFFYLGRGNPLSFFIYFFLCVKEWVKKETPLSCRKEIGCKSNSRGGVGEKEERRREEKTFQVFLVGRKTMKVWRKDPIINFF